MEFAVSYGKLLIGFSAILLVPLILLDGERKAKEILLAFINTVR
jgi:hypothetical protein